MKRKMIKLITMFLVIVLLTISNKINAQQPNAIYLAIQPVDLGLGITAKYPRFAIGLRMDILRWELSVDIGIPIFKKYKNDTRRSHK